jgi:hypothetical protein
MAEDDFINLRYDVGRHEDAKDIAELRRQLMEKEPI